MRFGSSRAVRWRTTPLVGIDYDRFIAGRLVALEREQYSKFTAEICDLGHTTPVLRTAPRLPTVIRTGRALRLGLNLLLPRPGPIIRIRYGALV